MRLGDLPVCADVSAARWLADALQPLGSGVASLVPAAFPAHARLFHPAVRYDGDDDIDVDWAEVAAANGTIDHPLMQWPALTGGWEYLTSASQPPTWDGQPGEGHLPAHVAVVLTGVLARHTTTPDDVWFARWDGFGHDAAALEGAARIDLGQTMVLAHGVLADAARNLAPEPHEQSANLWWPADRAFVVATDIDLMSTYVAASADCVAELLGTDGLEVAQARPGDPVGWDADDVNPLPARTVRA